MADCGHEHHHTGLSGGALDAELTRAEQRCEAAEQRLTPPRRRVLELLLEAGQPVKAYDLIAAYGQSGVPAKPPTVYRALEFLSQQGFAHRIESLNAYVACRRGEEGHAAASPSAWMGLAAEAISRVAPQQSQIRKAAGYALTGVTIEAHGLCADCRS